MSRLVGWVACSACGDLVSRLASHDGRCIACSLVQARRQAAEEMRERCAVFAYDLLTRARIEGDWDLRSVQSALVNDIRALEVTP